MCFSRNKSCQEQRLKFNIFELQDLLSKFSHQEPLKLAKFSHFAEKYHFLVFLVKFRGSERENRAPSGVGHDIQSCYK